MGKYRVEELDPLEFEKLCADILKIKTGFFFKNFKAGRDGGIDCENEENGIRRIAQCKHYTSCFANLYSSLRKEREKLDEISNISEYYVLTSMKLSPQETRKIYDLFSPKYMNDFTHIISLEDIDNILDDPINKNILFKYPNLWMCNTSILEYFINKNIILDCEVLSEKIIREDKYYVDNKYYRDCIQKININNCLLIYGLPGTGKSTISERIVVYLLNRYKAHNISLKYSTSMDYENIKKSISYDKNAFEVILLDDFLGTVCRDISHNNIKGLLSLIMFVKNSENKWLIMNSRIGILNNAFEGIDFFERTFNDLNIEKVEIGEYTLIEKARLLFKRLRVNLPIDYVNSVVKNKNYYKIITHKNYNPRLIEIITKSSYYKRHNPDNYFNEVLKTCIWYFKSVGYWPSEM